MSGTVTIVQILMQMGSMGSPSRWSITTLTFLIVLSCPFFSGTRPGRSWTDFHDLWLKRLVSAQGVLFVVRMIDDVIRGTYAPTPLKVGVNVKLQANMPRCKYRTISTTVYPIKQKFEDKAATTSCTSWVGYHYPKPNPGGWRLPSGWSLWRHNSAADDPIPMKVDTPNRYHMPMTVKGQNRNRK